MRIAYACYASAFSADGVNVKISSQLAHWRHGGHRAQLFCLTPAPAPGSTPVLCGHLFTFSGLRSRIGATLALVGAVNRFAPDVIYLRYDIFIPPVWGLRQTAPMVVEINTDDRGEALSGIRLGQAYHTLTRGLTLRAAAGFACVTHELARSPDLARLAKPTVVIANGADPPDVVQPTSPRVRDRVAAVMLVGYPGAWTGVDKAIELARLVPQLDLHLIGRDLVENPGQLPPNVILHGALDPRDYAQLLADTDFGLGPLALHRKAMMEASPLKVREYLLYGLPVLIAYEDTDFPGESPWFLLRLPNRECNIKPHVEAIRTWIETVQGRRVAHSEVAERVAMNAKERARLEFLTRLADASAGPRRPVPPGVSRATRVPPIKPWIYYRAVDRYDRLRTGARLKREPPATPTVGVRILGYHRVADDGDVLAVTRTNFRRQMEAVLASGARIIRLDAVPALLDAPIDGLQLAITFDDGYRDTLEHAAPVLRELQIPATVFLPTAMIDGRMNYYWYRSTPPPALDWTGVSELVADGLIDAGSHSRSHPRLPALDDRQLSAEIAGSKADIEDRLGTPVSAFCYPAGLYGAREAQAVRDAGYSSAVTCRPGLNQASANPELAELRRTLVSWGDDLDRFQAKLTGQLDRPSRLSEAMQRARGAGGLR